MQQPGFNLAAGDAAGLGLLDLLVQQLKEVGPTLDRPRHARFRNVVLLDGGGDEELKNAVHQRPPVPGRDLVDPLRSLVLAETEHPLEEVLAGTGRIGLERGRRQEMLGRVELAGRDSSGVLGHLAPAPVADAGQVCRQHPVTDRQLMGLYRVVPFDVADQ